MTNYAFFALLNYAFIGATTEAIPEWVEELIESRDSNGRELFTRVKGSKGKTGGSGRQETKGGDVHKMKRPKARGAQPPMEQERD